MNVTGANANHPLRPTDEDVTQLLEANNIKVSNSTDVSLTTGGAALSLAGAVTASAGYLIDSRFMMGTGACMTGLGAAASLTGTIFHRNEHKKSIHRREQLTGIYQNLVKIFTRAEQVLTQAPEQQAEQAENLQSLTAEASSLVRQMYDVNRSNTYDPDFKPAESTFDDPSTMSIGTGIGLTGVVMLGAGAQLHSRPLQAIGGITAILGPMVSAFNIILHHDAHQESETKENRLLTANAKLALTLNKISVAQTDANSPELLTALRELKNEIERELNDK